MSGEQVEAVPKGKAECEEFAALVGDPPESIAQWTPKSLQEELEARGWKGQKAGRVQAYHAYLKSGLQALPQAPQAGPSSGKICGFTSGHSLQHSIWEYQTSNTTNDKIRNGIAVNFDGWKKNTQDKFYHPFFFISSGPGVGKSRMLDEFHGICKGLTFTDPALPARFLNNCFVFPLTFENGTPLFPSTLDGEQEIGVRMHFQLVKSQDVNFRACMHEGKRPAAVMAELAAAMSLSLQDCTFIILLDSIQKSFYEVNGGTREKFQQLMTSITQLMCASQAYVVVACSATFYDAVEKFVSLSRHPCEFLYPAPIDGHKVISYDDPIVYVMVDDARGHARTLLVISDQLKEWGLPEDNNSDKFFSGVIHNLELHYPDLVKCGRKIIPALKYVITQQQVNRDTEIGPDLSVEQLVEMGLFTYTEKLTLTCPFVLLCLLKDRCQDLVLKNLSLPSYTSLESGSNARFLAAGWEDWERFVAQFIVLKTQLLADKPVKFSELHHGAMIGSDRDVKVTVPHLQGFEKLHHRVAPKDMRTHFTQDPTKLYINGESAKGADSFFGLSANGVIVSEVHQNKDTIKTITKDLWDDEIAKCKGGPDDFFIMFGTHHTSITQADLPPRGALVTRENFVEYFGPFAGRAFCTKKPINKVSREELMEAYGIGKGTANKILDERAKGKFADRDDFKERMKLKKTFSHMFTYEM